MYATQQQPYNSPASFAEKPTYEELDRLMREQERLIAVGIVQKPKLVSNFTIDDQIEWNKGLTAEFVFDNLNRKYEVV